MNYTLPQPRAERAPFLDDQPHLRSHERSGYLHAAREVDRSIGALVVLLANRDRVIGVELLERMIALASAVEDGPIALAKMDAAFSRFDAEVVGLAERRCSKRQAELDALVDDLAEHEHRISDIEVNRG